MPFSTIFLCAVQTTNHHFEMDIQNVLIHVVLGSKPEPTIIDFGEYLIMYLLPRSRKFCLVLKSQRDNQYTCQTIDQKNVIDACNQSLSISSHMRITCNQFRLVFTVAVSTILITSATRPCHWDFHRNAGISSCVQEHFRPTMAQNLGCLVHITAKIELHLCDIGLQKP